MTMHRRSDGVWFILRPYKGADGSFSIDVCVLPEVYR